MMKNKKNYLYPFFVFCSGIFVATWANAQQELIFPIQSNQIIKTEIAKQHNGSHFMRTASIAPDTLFLPFFEDFTENIVWPSADRWIDSSTFVNYNFPINPPTIGAVTFDGLDWQGNPYNNTNANAKGLCDELTSRPVNLFNDQNGLPYNSSDSLFLVFYYQRKGRGDNPENTDSLTVQFLDPATQQWISVWKAVGTTTGDTVFNKVKLSITDPVYRQNGFRFRFRNYGSLTGMLDIWNVDYISLNKFLPPDFENIRDYAFAYEGVSLLNNYSQIPWKHFTFLSAAQQQAFVTPSTDLTIRNNNDQSPFPIKVAGNVIDQYGNSTAIIGGPGLNSIVIPLNSNVSPVANLLTNSFFTDPTTDEVVDFTAEYDLGQTSGSFVDDYHQNDTLRYVQHFGKEYAYDDGTAELAYGVSGSGAQLAYKFEVLKGDTLRGVDIFFAQSGLSVTNLTFKLAIWTGNNIPVGAPVYQKLNQTPNYVDSINGFYTYLTDAVYTPPGTYYFGYIQLNPTILNIGLDTNTPADATRKFINYNGNWVTSQLPGMWMIRPIFSGTILNVGLADAASNNALKVYPVPAVDVVHIDFNHPDSERMKISITDITGRVVMNPVSFTSQLDVASVSSGIYFLHISDPVSGSEYTGKIVISGK